MDAQALKPYLDPLPLREWQYHPVVKSTNDLALAWAREDAPDRALVIADAQTAGRGRGGRRWVTRPGTALAFSLILRPTPPEVSCVPRFTALAALGLIDTLEKWGLQGEVKWPNDVLLKGKKAAGVLVEADWQDDVPTALMVGMGVNVTPESVPPEDELRYPATSVEDAIGKGVDRWALLAETLSAMLAYREMLTTPEFMEAWNAHLALRGVWVLFRMLDGKTERMKVLGVLPDGRLSLEKGEGERIKAAAGEIEVAYNENIKNE
jgi:BirA family transcriptional regulator, biotin operon repressor / biotin---[acetyl-CoA-carboxylase] ligase